MSASFQQPGPLRFAFDGEADEATLQRIIARVTRLREVTSARVVDNKHIVVYHKLDEKLNNAGKRFDAKIDLHDDVDAIIRTEAREAAYAAHLSNR